MRKLILSACCVSLLAAGCNNSGRPMSQDEVGESNLRQVGELCRYYQVAKKKPPQKLADLVSVRSYAGSGYEAVRSGEIVLLYNAMLTDTGDEPGQGTSDDVLAYQKQVPESGGKVLMLNRGIRSMSAEEFKSAKKAGKG
jgi:hypothetical protein